MNCLVTSHGSTGDIFPIIALGHALSQSGHQVRFAAPLLFKEDAERAGLEFVPVPPDWSREDFAKVMQGLCDTSGKMNQLKYIYESALPYVEGYFDILKEQMQWADMLVGSYLFPHLQLVAQKFGKPFAVLCFCHQSIPATDYAPDGLPQLRWLPVGIRRRWYRSSWQMADRVVDRVVNKILAEALKANGLPQPQNFFSKPADLALVTVSPTLMPPAMGLSQNYRYCGYLRWQAQEDPAIGQELEAFTQGEKVPVLTFGSVTEKGTKAQLATFLAHWPKGNKLILQSGWAGLEASKYRPEIYTVGSLSHDQLFAFASVVIHHGGAGTTASALHAGRAHIIIPRIGDQFFWARQIKKLGCGIELSRKRWAQTLTPAIKKVESEPHFSERAKEAAKVLAVENGAAEAVAQLEHLHSSWKKK